LEKVLIKDKEKFLIITPYFYPFYKFGGAAVTISNLYFAMKDQLNLTVLSNSWSSEIQSSNSIKYLNSPIQVLAYIKNNHHKYKSIYLNSFFSPSWSILPYTFLKVIGFKGDIIFFPRGELKKNALTFKSAKKSIYLSFFKKILNSRSNTFIVSDELEAEDLKSIFPKNSSVIVPDFLPPYQKSINQKDKTNKFNLVFISHLRESKNLMFVLKLLKKLPGDFYLTVYGNADDPSYFNKCMNFINKNEMKHRIYLKGLISHDEIIDTFADHNFFIFPTKTENFGYVILESMLGGCIPIISKYTPWSEMEDFPGLSLDLDLQTWSNNLLELVDNPKKIKEIQSLCKNFANNFVTTSTSKDKFLAHIYDR